MSGKTPMGVKDDLPDLTLFLVEIAPHWAESFIEVLTSGLAKTKGLTYETMDELFHYKPYVLISGRLYKRGLDGILCLYIGPKEYALIIKNAHISWDGSHVSGRQTTQRILMEGFWWPDLHKHVENHVHHCDQCSLSPPVRYVTLFHINPIPKWSSYLVQYLKSQTLDNSMPKHRQ